METIQLTRKELYDLVWSTPLSKIAEKYAVNPDGIKKICKEFNVPMPPNGYWSKMKFNKIVEKDKLDEDFKGQDKIVFTSKIEGEDNNSNQTPLTILISQIKNDVKAPTAVPSRLINPDKLTIQTQEYWERENKERYYRDDAKIILPIRVEKNKFLIILNGLNLVYSTAFIFETNKAMIKPKTPIKANENRKPNSSAM